MRLVFKVVGFGIIDDMKKITKGVLVVIGVLLILNGLINISDNGTVLAYDITTILAGIGFSLVVILLNF